MPKDLRSKFEIKQAAKLEAEKAVEDEKRRQEEEERAAVCVVSLLCEYYSMYVDVMPLYEMYFSMNILKSKSTVFRRAVLEFTFISTKAGPLSLYLLYM